MAKTMKVLDIHNGAIRLCCIKDFCEATNPYRLYTVEWRDGALRKRQLARYDTFRDVIWHINNAATAMNWQ